MSQEASDGANKEYKTAYMYTRVSTAIQVDGFSLEGQEKEIQEYCNAFKIKIVQKFSDEGKSGKSIQGRPQFKRMLKEIEEKEEVDYIIVWKLSRFGRNAREVLNALDFIEKHGCSLISKEDNINSSTKEGKMLIALISIVAEMERENIIEQTNNGKKYNAMNGGWNGGQAPYGYKLVDKGLVVNEEEAEIVKRIFYLFTVEKRGYVGITGILNQEGIRPRQVKKLNRKAMGESSTDEKIYLSVQEDWDNSAVKRILDNPVYFGKLRYGASRIEKKDGKEIRHKRSNPIFVDGKHEAIISEELWYMAQDRRKETGIKFNKNNINNDKIRNMLNGIARCPQCGGTMVAFRDQYTKKDGTVNVYYNYICGYYNNHKNGKCRKNAIKADILEDTVIREIKRYINRPNVIEEITRHLGSQLDTKELEKEIKAIEKELEALEKNEELQYNILSQIGRQGKYKNIKEDKILDILDKLTEQKELGEKQLKSKKEELRAVEQNKLNSETIHLILENFEKALEYATVEQRKELVRSLVKEVKLGFIEGTEKGVEPVSMTLNFTGEQIDLMCDNFGVKESHVETVCLLSRKSPV